MTTHVGFQNPVAEAVMFVFGIVLFTRGFKIWRERRLIQNTPKARIRSMAMGLVEIEGTVEPRSVLAAPFSGNACAFWEVDISTRTKNGWRVVHRNASGHPFFIQDGTASALVYPQGAECKLMPGVEEVCNGPMLPPCYADYLKEQHLPLLNLMSVGTMRFRERMIQDGQRVFIMGSANPRPHAVALSDDDEIQATGTDGKPSRVAQLDEATAAVVRKGTNEPTFIISEESERALTLDLGLQSAAQLVGGPLLTLFALGMALMSFTTGHRVH